MHWDKLRATHTLACVVLRGCRLRHCCYWQGSRLMLSKMMTNSAAMTTSGSSDHGGLPPLQRPAVNQRGLHSSYTPGAVLLSCTQLLPCSAAHAAAAPGLRLHNRVHGGGIDARMLAKDASFD